MNGIQMALINCIQELLIKLYYYYLLITNVYLNHLHYLHNKLQIPKMCLYFKNVQIEQNKIWFIKLNILCSLDSNTFK